MKMSPLGKDCTATAGSTFEMRQFNVRVHDHSVAPARELKTEIDIVVIDGKSGIEAPNLLEYAATDS